MGLEKTCEVRHDGKTVTVAAHLEPAELRLRGPLKLTIPVGEMKSAEARAGVLQVKWPGGTVDLPRRVSW